MPSTRPGVTPTTSPASASATVTTALVGPPATDELWSLLDRSSDPLGPALVVCATPLVAVGVRRDLGRRAGGVAGVDVMTFERLIEDLSRDALAAVDQHPAGSLEMQAAVRRVLATAPGRFGVVAEHRTTEERLLRLEDEVVGLPREDFKRLASTPGLPGDAFRVLDAAAEQLGSARVRSHVVQLAVEAVEHLPLGAKGPIVVYLPEPARPQEARMLRALGRRADTTILVGVTGHGEVDRQHFARLAGFGVSVAAKPQLEPPARARRIEVADPEDEVRTALRELVSWAASGTPLSRMALLYTAVDPYAALIEDALVSAGLPYSGPGHRPLGSSLAGRTLLRLLGLVQSGLERSAVITLLASAPIRTPANTLAPSTVWDQLSRQAGVVDGDDWVPRVTRMADHLEDETERMAARALVEFIEDLQSRLRVDLEARRSWQEWSDWAIGLLDDLLRHDLVPAECWPESEVVAFERITGVLGRLRTLDGFDSTPSFEAFAATVAGELDASMVPGRPAGRGLLTAPVGAVSGLSFERVAVVGLNEGTFPRTGREDSLLPDQVRASAGAWLLTKAQAPSLDIRALTSVVVASVQEPLLTTARGDLRSRRSKVWPRQLDSLAPEPIVIDSHHRGLVDHGRPASATDVGIRSLVRHVDGGDPVHTHPLAMADPVLSAGLTRHLDRAKSGLTAHTGRVERGLVDPTIRPLSPTALEDYAACPRKYLFGRVLRLGVDEAPERIEEISPRDRGTLVHLILERFVGEAIEAGTVPAPGVAWSPKQTDRLLELLDSSVEESADLGITGGRVQTEILRRQLRGEALNFVDLDNQTRADNSSSPVAVEHRFGFDDANPLIMGVQDGRRLKIRGVVDRVDLTDDGGLLVIDYKGGSAGPFRGMESDPLKGGTRLQLPLYARVLADEFERAGPRHALYWLTKQNSLLPLELDRDIEAMLDTHVGAALDGITDGLFPAIPGDSVSWPRPTFSNCTFCDFDRICPTDRQKEWVDVANDPLLTPIDILLGRQPAEGQS